MRFRLLFPILFSAIILQSCSSGNNKQKATTATETKDTLAPKEKFEKGKIIEQVKCKNDPSQSYAMYLPTTYSTEKTFPIIFVFDAHGTGKLPVSLYKDLAEQYGYILVGSNNSKNGTAWEESKIIAEKLFSDAENRLSVNRERIYLLGFSGGARVANGITITNGAIAGVICCGAAAPATNSANPRNNYTLLEIVGNEDFNYVEMKKYDMIDIAGHDVNHALITFNGKHEWPPKDIMDDGFWWLELNEMRKNSAAKNDSLIAKRLQPLIKQLKEYQQKGQMFDAYQLCCKTITFYNGLADLSYCFATYKSLQTNSEVDKGLKKEEESWKKEGTLDQYYLKAFQTQNMDWWQKDIASLNQKIKKGKDKDQVLIYKRVLGYLSLAVYMQASGTLQQNNMNAADHFCKLYVLIDPTNTEAHYLMASVNAKQGKTKEAIRSLNAAITNGFVDVARLQRDSTFIGIKNTKEFWDLVRKVGASYMVK